jgi:hypothetical protein
MLNATHEGGAVGVSKVGPEVATQVATPEFYCGGPIPTRLPAGPSEEQLLRGYAVNNLAAVGCA